MPAIVIYSVLALVVILIAWMIAGSRVAGLVDRYHTVHEADIPSDTFALYPGYIQIGPLPWALTEDIAIGRDTEDRLTFTTTDGAFTLGPATGSFEPGEVHCHFTPEPGDTISFVRSHSVISWPILDLGFLAGSRRKSTWQRHAYERLFWKKSSGATLELIWQIDQRFYPKQSGWDPSHADALPTIKITPASTNPAK